MSRPSTAPTEALKYAGSSLSSFPSFTDSAEEKPSAPPSNSASSDQLVAQLFLSEWSLEEDKLLIKCREFEPALPWAQVIKIYKQLRKKDPLSYTKNSPTAELLHERLSAIRNTDRYNMLKANLEEEDEFIRRTTATGPASSSSIPPDSNSLSSSSSSLPTDSDLKKLSAKEKLDVTLIGRNFGKKKITTAKRPLVQHSAVIKALTDGWVPSDTEERQQLVLSDRAPKYERVDTFDHFDPENFHRLVVFCRHPEAHTKERELQAKLEQIQQQLDAFVAAEQRERKERQESALRHLATMRRAEEDAIAAALEEDFRRELEELRARYDAAGRTQRAAVAAKYESAERDMAGHYIREETKLAELHERARYKERSALAADLADVRAVTAVIFPPGKLLRLLILADDLQVESLRLSCVDKIAADFKTYISCPELRCALIREDTHKTLLSRLRSDVLVELAATDPHGPNGYPFPSLVERELGYRRKIAAEQYRTMPMARLQEMLADSRTPFRDLLAEEIATRTKTFPVFVMDPAGLPPGVNVSDDGLGVSAAAPVGAGIAGRKYVCVHATQKKTAAAGEPARYYFEMAVNMLRSPEDGSVAVGWDPPRGSLVNVVPGMTAAEDALGAGYAYQCDGMLHYQGRAVYSGVQYAKGDVIGVLLDQSAGTVAFYKNGKQVPIAGNENGTITIQEKDYQLFPCVGLYTMSEREHISVTLNFKGPFAFPQELAQPLGRPT